MLFLNAGCLFNLFVRRMFPAALAKLLDLQTASRRLFVLRGRVVPLFAIAAL